MTFQLVFLHFLLLIRVAKMLFMFLNECCSVCIFLLILFFRNISHLCRSYTTFIILCIHFKHYCPLEFLNVIFLDSFKNNAAYNALNVKK